MKVKKIQKKKFKEKPKGLKKYNHEIIGILMFALGLLMFFSFILQNSIGIFGTIVREFLLGLMGLPAGLVPPLIVIYSVFMIFKKDDSNFNKRIVHTLILLLLVSALIQTGNYRPEKYVNLSVMDNIVKFFKDGAGLNDGGLLGGGGILGGIISTPFLLMFRTLGTIIILLTFSIVDIILLTNISIANFVRNIRRFFEKKQKSLNKIVKIKPNAGEAIDISYEPEITGENGNLALEFRPKPKIIDFSIEKTSRELQEKTGSQDNKRNSSEFEDVEPLELAAEEIKKKTNIENTVIKVEVKEPVIHENTNMNYKFPPIDLLNDNPEDTQSVKSHKATAIEGAKKLEETLASFGVDAKVINISRGPAVTRYELQPSPGVKVSKIVNLSDDISLNLASSGVRIEAPIPGKAAIGIEVPNKEVTSVFQRELIASSDFERFPSKLAFTIGKDISGKSIVADIAKMPHMLISGATGSGKGVCINSLIISLLYKSTPNEVKMLMIDPKVVELGIYNGIPHLLIPVVTDPRKAAGALNWAVQEMVNRYKLFAEKGVRDLKGYNLLQMKEVGDQAVMPQIVIIIDELADLMMVAPNDVEDAICRLAQMARAAGMHLVIATQRPSVDVITGIIKANIPSRISFAVTSQVDSRTILDMGGAEKLQGKGDMLFFPVGEPKPIRVKGVFVSDKEVEKVVGFIKEQAAAEYNNSIIEEINNENEPEESNRGDNDELLNQAIDLVVEAGQASVSLIQRKFKVGYSRAARIVDQMEARGIVGGFEGSKPRRILISKLQWQEMQMADGNS